MNNPFLSDRNIFSKVVNPLKKKSETEKKEFLAPQNTNKLEPVLSKNSDINLASKYQSLKEKPILVGNANNNQPIGKMSFGKPLEIDNRLSFNSNNFELGYADQLQHQIKTVNQYQKKQNFNYVSSESNAFIKNDYKSLSLEQNGELTSPNQEYKFQEYRKANNYSEFSPIQQQMGQRLEDSEFLNIDAIGQDLNRFLASSKNQEEICKLLGLNMQTKKAQQPQKERQQKQSQVKRVQRVVTPKQPKQQANVGSMFAKQKKPLAQKQVYRPEYPRKVEQLQRDDRQYVPTFNYTGLDEQNETLSREQDYIPRFAGVAEVRKAQTNQNDKESIEVFNYSQNNVTKSQLTLQDMINEEMNVLSWNGKYRTFLTSGEKIVTYKYKLQPL